MRFSATVDFATSFEVCESPRRQGLCHQYAYLWAPNDFSPRSQALGSSICQGLCSPSAQLLAIGDCVFCYEVLGCP